MFVQSLQFFFIIFLFYFTMQERKIIIILFSPFCTRVLYASSEKEHGTRNWQKNYFLRLTRLIDDRCDKALCRVRRNKKNYYKDFFFFNRTVFSLQLFIAFTCDYIKSASKNDILIYSLYNYSVFLRKNITGLPGGNIFSKTCVPSSRDSNNRCRA
ncbi:hypothetical protein PUN28_004821 [Cardiocondyla obscurior]|uniref:Secreted protein n=1 Tax=Cardiocondyla obscurior TaxID=286306 RepID=A0AAW2GFS5_9HYME